MKTHKPVLSSITRLPAFVEPKGPARRRKSAGGVLLTGFFTLLVALVIAGTLNASASNWAWSTAPGSANFSGVNWTSGTTPGAAGGTPSSADSLYFGTSSQLSLNNDDTSFSFAGLTFNSGANAFTIGGNAITLTGNIANSSTSLETINFPIATTSARTITMTSGGGNVTLGGNISGASGGLTLAGTGTLTLSGNNTYTGAITTTATTVLQLQANGVNTTAGVSTAMATQNFTTTTLPTGSTIQLRADSTVASGGVVSFDSGATEMGVNGSGTRLGGTYNFDVNNISTGTGQILYFGPQNTTISGTTAWQVGTGTPTFNVTGGNGYSLELNGLYVGNGVSVVFNPTTANLIIAQGILGASAGGITKNGAGTLTIGGADNYTGNTTVSANAGILVLSGTNYNGASATTTVNNGGTLQLQANNGNTGNFTTTSKALGTASGKLTLANGSTLQLRSDTSVTFNGTDALGGLNGVTTTIDVNNITAGTLNQTLTMGSAATGIGTTGQFNITGGNGYTLAFGALQTANGTGNTETFNPTSASVTIASYNNAVGAANTLALAGTSTGNAVLGAIANSTGSLAVTKSGASTWTLSGANTYGGATTISAGTLQVGNGSGGSLNNSSALSVSGGATLAFDEANGGAQTQGIADAGTVVGAEGSGITNTLSGAITGAGGFTQNGQGSTILSSAGNTYAGNTTITAGTLALSGGALASASTIKIGAGGSFDVSALGGTYALGSGGLNASGTGTTVGTTAATIVPASGGIFDLGSQPVALTWSGASSGTDSAHPALNVSQGTLNFNGNTITVIVPGTALGAGTYTLVTAAAITGSPSSAPSYIGGNGLQLGFSGSLSVVGGNTLVLTVQLSGTIATWTDGSGTDNNWSDSGNWSGGVPHLAGQTAILGSVVSPVVLDTAETVGTLLFTNPGSYTISGGNTLTLDNNNFGAAVNVTAGATNVIQTPVALSDNAVIAVGGAHQLTVSGAIGNTSAAKALTISGGGTAILSQANSYGPSAGSVGTTLGGATVQVGNNSALGSGDVSVTSSSTLQSGAAGLSVANNIAVSSAQTATVDNNGNNLTLGGVISGGGALTKIGTGTLTLSGVNTRSGAMTISAGALVVGDPGQLGGGTYAANITNNGALTYNSSAAQTLSGIISGSGALNENGSGSLTLSGANTFTNTTTISAGTLTLANQNALQNSTLNYNGGSLIFSGITAATLGALSGTADLSLVNDVLAPVALTVGGNNSTTAYSGVLSDSNGAFGPGSLTKNGTGTLTLSGNNSYTGASTINAGTLALSGANTSTSTTIGASGTLQLQANSGNTSAGVSSVMANQNIPTAQLASGATIQLRADSTVASGGVVSFNSGATLIGSTGSGTHLNGTYNFDVNNISTGTGIILYFGPQNTLSSTTGWYVGNSGATPTFNVTGGNGYSLEINGLWVGNNDSVVLNPTTANLVIAQGIQNGSTGGITKNGAGTLTLMGASTSTGTTTISAGTLQLGNGGSLSASSAITDNGTFAINESGSVVQGTAFSGAAITGTGGLTQMGSGSTTLTAANTYSGGTVLQAGTLQVSGINNLGSGTYGGVTFNGGTLQYAAAAGGAGSLDLSSGTGITLSSGGGIVDVNGNTVTYAGAIGHSGSGALIVQDTAGGGVLNLNGANTYTNVTTINSGATIGGTGSLAGALTLSSGANALMTANSPLTVAGAVTLNGNTFATTAPLTTGTYTLLTGGSIAGGSTVNATPKAGSVAGGYNGTVSISGNSVILTVIVAGTLATWTDGNADQNWSEAGNWSGGVPHLAGDTATFNSAGGSAVTLDANEAVAAITLNNPSSDVISGGNTLTLDNSGGGATITVSAGTANAINTSVALNDNAAIIANSGKSLTLGGTVANGSGSKTLAITGGGTNILSQANSYGPSAGSVGTTVGGATTVQVGNNTALGSGDVGVSGNSTIQAGAAGLSLANNIAMADATTVDNNGNNLTLGGVISGGGALTKIGTGTLTLSGVNTRSGAMTISTGALVVGGQLGGGTYAANITNNGSLTYNSSASQTLSGIISGSGTLNENGSGSLTLSSANTFTNTTTINAGTLTLANQNALQNSTLNYSSGSLTFNGITAATLGGLTGTVDLSLANAALAPVALTVGGNNSTTAYSGVLSDYNGAFGPSSLTKNGTGTLTLSGNETYTGASTINAGTLTLSGDNSGRPTASANTTVVNNGGTLQLQANGGNTSGGTSTALSSEVSAAALVLHNGSTVQLRGDSSVTFAGANNLGGTGSSTIALDVNQLTGAGANNTLTLVPGGFNVLVTTLNVTGGNGYTLGLGVLTDVNFQTNANATTINPTTANVTVAGLGGSTAWPHTFILGGTSTGNMVTGPIANASGTTTITKTGSGTWTLPAANTYSGATTVSNGTLVVNGSIGSGNVTVAGGTLAGIGTIGGATTLQSAAILNPGTNGIGTLTLSGNLTLNAASTNQFVVTSGGVSNSVAVGGQLSPNSSVIEINTAGGQLAAGTYANLFTYGTTNGTRFTALPVFDTAQTGTTAIITNDGAGHINLVVSSTVTISSDASLSFLALNPLGTLSPAFSSAVTNYTATNANANTSVTVTVTNTSVYATNVLFFNGTPQATNAGSLAASVPLVVGSGNVIQVVVTAQDGVTTSTNTVTVTRLPSSNALLSNLVINPAGTLYPTPFSSGTTSYNATNTYVNNPVTVTATSGDGTAALALTFNGTPVGSLTSGTPSGNQSLVLPTNTVAVQVVSQDLTQTNVYTVNVLLQPSQTVPKLTNSVSGSTLTLTWPADHLGYRLLTQTNNLNKGVSSVASDWGTVSGSTAVTTTNITIIKATNNAYYRLVYP